LNVISAYRKHFTVAALEVKNHGTTKFVTSVPADIIAVIRLSAITVFLLVHVPRI
jgi:uncharacterized protein YbaA (DUF1428 family)